MSTIEIKDDVLYTIDQICKIFSLSRVYVHRYMTEGKLVAHKEPVPGMKNTERWVAAGADIKVWRAKSHQNRRADGRSRYVLHATAEELAEIKAELEARKSGAQISKQNAPKATEAQGAAE